MSRIATGVRIRSVVFGASADHPTLSVSDSPEDPRVPDRPDDPHLADPTLTGADVVETAGQTIKGAQEAERRCNREREGVADVFYWVFRCCVVAITLCLLCPFTFAFCVGGDERPVLSVWEVASVFGIHRYLLVGLEDLQRRRECEVAIVNGVRVLHASLVHDRVALPVALDAWSTRVMPALNAESGDAVILLAFSVVLTIKSAVDLCGPPFIWWGSLSIRTLVPLVTKAVPCVRDAVLGQCSSLP
jgi:hypothetical protein